MSCNGWLRVDTARLREPYQLLLKAHSSCRDRGLSDMCDSWGEHVAKWIETGRMAWPTSIRAIGCCLSPNPTGTVRHWSRERRCTAGIKKSWNISISRHNGRAGGGWENGLNADSLGQVDAQASTSLLSTESSLTASGNYKTCNAQSTLVWCHPSQ